MKLFWQNKGKHGEPPGLEAILASARPDPEPLAAEAADALFRRAMAEAFSESAAPMRLPDRPAASARPFARTWAAAGAMATVLVAAGGIYLAWDASWDKPEPVAAPPKPGWTAALPTQKPAIRPMPRVAESAGQTRPAPVRARPSARVQRQTHAPAILDKRDTPRRASTARRAIGTRAARTMPSVPANPSAALKNPATAPEAASPYDDRMAMLLVMVDPASDPLNVEVERAAEDVPGYARVAAYTPDEDGGGGTVTEATVLVSDGVSSTALREGRLDPSGDGGTLHVEVTRTMEPTPAMESIPAVDEVSADEPDGDLPGAEPATGPGEPAPDKTDLKDFRDRGVER